MFKTVVSLLSGHVSYICALRDESLMCDPSRGFVQHRTHLGPKKADQSLEDGHDV
jgi:hypothetical protein